MKEAGRLNRVWRSRLTSSWLRDKDGNIKEHPPAKYEQYIRVEDWQAFVAKRMDPSFQELSEKNRKRASQPQCPYRKSRLGMARLEEQIIESGSTEVTSVPRHALWIAARKNSDGEIDNENVRQVAAECENLSLSQPQGIADSNSSTDILSRALKKPEYHGRVRGKGFGVTHRSYFPPQKRAKQADLDRLGHCLEQVMQEVRELRQEVRRGASTPTPTSTPALAPKPSSAKDSCNLAFNNLPEDFLAKSATQNTKQSFCASKNGGGKGKAVVQDPSPPPTTEQSVLLPRLCKYVQVLLIDLPESEMIIVPFDTAIFGYPHDESIDALSIKHLIEQEMIGVAAINIYISYLWQEIMRPFRITHRFFFLSPHRVNFSRPIGEQRTHIVDTLKAVDQLKDRLVLVLYNTGGHWLLLAINSGQEIVYYLDSCDVDPNNHKDLKKLFNEVIKIIRPHLGNQVTKIKQNNITWIKIACPQQTNTKDCGFYVMRYMKEIVACNLTSIPQKYFYRYN